MRTLEQIRNFNNIERNHWQLMCDIADNDYDISYFCGRETANDNFNDYLQDLNECNIDLILTYLTSELYDVYNEHKIYLKENPGIHNENYIGCIDELKLLIRFIKQDYATEY